MRRLIVAGLLLMPLLAIAEPPPPPDVTADDGLPDLENVPEVPDAPLPVQSGEAMEPDQEADITIIRKGDKTFHEYRQNGVLYMVKVVPDIGPPYYFIDHDRDGNWDVRGNDVEAGTRVNQWKIFSWK